ncbi:MAG: hypothetical protein ACI358_06845 [Candidatus Limimorpha sp.]
MILKILVFVLTLLLLSLPMVAAVRGEIDKNSDTVASKYDGGMMLHIGFLSGEISPISFETEGMTIGIGGSIKFHIGNHVRIGTEGYVSTMQTLSNGSFVKFGWGGILADYRLYIGRIMPYLGVTVGGGSRACLILFDGNNKDWENETSVVFNKQQFFAIAPFVGVDFVVTPKFHLTFKIDWLNALSYKELIMPDGPRFYFGSLMYH